MYVVSFFISYFNLSWNCNLLLVPEHAAMAKYLIGGVGAAREFGQSDAKALEVVEFLNQINQLNR